MRIVVVVWLYQRYMLSSDLGKMFIDLGMLQEGCYESSNNLYSCNEGKNLSLHKNLIFFGTLQSNSYVTHLLQFTDV